MLTSREHEAMSLTTQLYNALVDITKQPACPEAARSDLHELTLHLHAIQNAILANSAARVYPTQYRLLGSNLRGLAMDIVEDPNVPPDTVILVGSCACGHPAANHALGGCLWISPSDELCPCTTDRARLTAVIKGVSNG